MRYFFSTHAAKMKKKPPVILKRITTSKHKAMEEQLKLRTMLLDSAIDSIILFEPSGRLLYANDVACSCHGYSREEFMKLNLDDLLTPESRAGCEERRKRVQEKGQDIYFVDHLHKNGSVIPFEVHSRVIEYAGEKIIFGIDRDISERQKSESELRLRAQLLDGATDSIILFDFAGSVLYANAAAAELRGYSREELSAMKVRDFIPPHLLEGFEQRNNKLLDEGKNIYETAALHKTGIEIPIEINSRVIEAGGKKVIFSIARDLRERKNVESELQLKAEIIDNVNDAVNLIDFAGNIVFVNAEACRMLGYTFAELTSMNMSQIDTPEYAKGGPSRRNTAAEQNYHSFESVHIRKDGSTIPVEANIRVIDTGGRKLILGVVRNITERKKTEEQRRELEQKAHVAGRLATVGEMAAGIAHEINNPLTGVIGYAQLLMQRGELPEDVMKDLNTIYEGSQRVANIIKRMLSFARQTRPVRNYAFINDIIQNTLELRSYHLKTNNINIHLKLDPSLPVTIADTGQLQQVLLNLIINAEMAIKQARVKGVITIKTAKENEIIKITVADDGPGISRENLNRVFDPFFTTKEVGQGTGLGLSVCHGIITEHNGRIYAESKPGHGATFTIELPIVTESQQLEMDVNPAEVENPISKAKILVVDDEDVIRDLLSRILTGEGHEVDTIDNAADALALIEKRRYSIILLDIKMPGTSGIELYHSIKKLARSLANRIIFITGDVMAQETMEFLTKNNARYLAKPIDPNILKAKINEILVS
jgi:PAS domain S-box-containing protein